MNKFNYGVVIRGSGRELGSIIEDNEELCKKLTVTPAWIEEKTGIKRRYLVSDSESTSSLATRAALKALKDAEIESDQIDLIVVCTFSGDYIFPPVSMKVQLNLQAKNAQTFDLQANCTGFVTGLTVASDRMLVDSSIRNALVVGVELNSRYVDRSDVNTAIYLSDGAGAVVLSKSKVGKGILGSYFCTDSSSYEAVRMRGGGSSFRSNLDRDDGTVQYMEMNGLATWKQAITHLPRVIKGACEKTGFALADIDFLIFHQANQNMIEYVVRKMGFSLSQTFINVGEVGNTGAASAAIALDEARRNGLIKSNCNVVLAAVGAGFNFGASVWRW